MLRTCQSAYGKRKVAEAPSCPQPVDGLRAYRWRTRWWQLPLTGFRAHAMVLGLQRTHTAERVTKLGEGEPVALVLVALMLVGWIRPSCLCIRQELGSALEHWVKPCRA